MNSMIRVVTLLALVSAVSAAQSGRPPVAPPAPPTPPTPPTPLAHPAPLARVHIDSDALAETIRAASLDAERMSRDFAPMARDIAARAREMSRQSVEESRTAMESMRISMEDMHLGDIHIPAIHIGGAYDFGPRYQDDPGDSLYHSAQGLFNNSDFRAAAQRFKEVQTKYPNSRYIASAMYWQAFSLYRVGGDAELKEALAVLDAQQKQFPNAMNPASEGRGRGVNTNVTISSDVNVGRGFGVGRGVTYVGNGGRVTDVPTLQMRIRSKLAERGDAGAKRQLDAAASDSTCDREEASVQIAALSGLMQSDPALASTHLDKILAKRDKCSILLRQSALSILVRNGDAKSVGTLIATAKSDPSAQLRSTAVDYLSRVQSDDALTTLESLAKNEQNESVRRSAARGLVGNSSNRARQAVRGLVEDNTVPDEIRIEMLDRFGGDRGTAEDATWLRAAYPKVTSVRVKRSIVGAVSRIGGQDSQKWLIDLSTNDQEPSAIRGEALRSVTKSMTVAQLSSAYDNAGSGQQRESLVDALNSRKEPEAVDKLLDIVKKGTDAQLRIKVIHLLSSRNDPKVTAALLAVIDR
jgi:TolA-binding protein/HEAT repeat protein